MKLKLDEQGHVVVQDDKPVYTHDDGKDVAFDTPSAVSKITALNAEAKGHREAKETAEARAKAFEGIEDPERARAVLTTVANLDAGQLVQAGKLDEIKQAAIAVTGEKFKAQPSHAEVSSSMMYMVGIPNSVCAYSNRGLSVTRFKAPSCSGYGFGVLSAGRRGRVATAGIYNANLLILIG